MRSSCFLRAVRSMVSGPGQTSQTTLADIATRTRSETTMRRSTSSPPSSRFRSAVVPKTPLWRMQSRGKNFRPARNEGSRSGKTP